MGFVLALALAGSILVFGGSDALTGLYEMAFDGSGV